MLMGAPGLNLAPGPPPCLGTKELPSSPPGLALSSQMLSFNKC